MSALDWLMGTLALAAIAPCLYLLLLVPFAALARMRGRDLGRGEPGPLAFVIPAHNEETDIENTLRDLSAAADGETSIHVIADNCTDRTAEIVRAFIAQSSLPIVLWERQDATKKAKGYALEWAIPQIFAWSDQRQQSIAFLCVVDADATLSAGSIARAREGFAAGHTVLQSYYLFGDGIGLRAQVMRIAAGAFSVRGLARSVLGLSDTLKGNGMWFRRSVIEQ
jgi:cellulose synthase/poly-beta-1,6-N-acetylglucosamine synthase-like glycosyltransferase